MHVPRLARAKARPKASLAASNLCVLASSMRRLVKGIRMAEFHFSPNAVDVSLLSALFWGNLLPGAWKGPSSGCHLCGALDVPDAKRSHRDGTSAVHRKTVSSVSSCSLQVSCEKTLSVAERAGGPAGASRAPKPERSARPTPRPQPLSAGGTRSGSSGQRASRRPVSGPPQPWPASSRSCRPFPRSSCRGGEGRCPSRTAP